MCQTFPYCYWKRQYFLFLLIRSRREKPLIISWNIPKHSYIVMIIYVMKWWWVPTSVSLLAINYTPGHYRQTKRHMICHEYLCGKLCFGYTAGTTYITTFQPIYYPWNITNKVLYTLYPRAFAETWNSNCQNGLQRSWLLNTSCWKCVSMVILSIIKALLTIRNLWWLVVTFSLLTSLVSDSAPKMLHIIWQTQSMFNNQYHHWPSKRDRCNISN